VAFTETEKQQILFVLGFGMAENNGEAMRAINNVDAFESTGGVIVRMLLEEVMYYRGQMRTTIPLSKMIEDGSIKLRSHYTLGHIQTLGRIAVGQLARYLKVSPAGDIFSTGGDVRDPHDFYGRSPVP
jgi:hypothetical protein